MKKSPLEIAVFLVSLLLILGTLGVFVYDGFIKPKTAAIITVNPRLKALRKVRAGYELPVIIKNTGDETAQDLKARITARTKSGRETNNILIPFLPEGSSRQAIVVFSSKPFMKSIKPEVESYNIP